MKNLGLLTEISADGVREDAHKKNDFFSGRTTKVPPSLDLIQNHFFTIFFYLFLEING